MEARENLRKKVEEESRRLIKMGVREIKRRGGGRWGEKREDRMGEGKGTKGEEHK